MLQVQLFSAFRNFISGVGLLYQSEILKADIFLKYCSTREVSLEESVIP